MRIQADYKVRVVTLDNLRAMCEYVSGLHCHKYEVAKVTPSRVCVSYSNEDEWTYEHPMRAVYPLYPGTFPGSEKDNPMVVLEMLRVAGCNGYGWEKFILLQDCPQLWRDPTDGQWREIKRKE